ncbi:hypothetical protein ELH67_33075 (plasmid) [Rhizobium ruizarguesonis]|uniref:hypothetical protein n=1 Tax=Rhizobium TaxID=379 RepID=UPI00102F7208|nr:hypothetical protein [Rhizobium ruizarguesonis]TAZ86935.1 hypothetical protein ELH67_33075 [Rhizobium ruizarguesonis]TBA32452.1 hypothetical protein ELH60_28530 [Rhizobium ruizarguesonis]TBC53333.1 hypothetical protein ELH36_34580 [Rhizobium ruizarguesonis]
MGDTSGVSEDNPVAWQVDMVRRQHWEIVEEMRRPAEAALAAEVERLREYYAAVQTNGGLIENHSSYECPGWRLGKQYKPCTCGAIERKTRVDAAVAALAQQKQEG